MTITLTVFGVSLTLGIIVALFCGVSLFMVSTMDAGPSISAVLYSIMFGLLFGVGVFFLAYLILAGLSVTF